MKKKTPDVAFPLETIFPGIHAERPDIAACEAETFLAYGASPKGFDSSDPDVRAWIDGPPEKFVDFHIAPVPEVFTLRLSALPDDWDERPECNPAADALMDEMTAHLRLPAHLVVRILEDKEAWVCRK